MTLSITHQMHLQNSRIITFVGAGGKTTLMYALGKEMAQTKKTLVTTTTHIMEPRDLTGASLVTEDSREQILSAFRTSSLVALGRPVPAAAPAKWSSFSRAFLDSIRDIPERILCEGDGSRRLPVKIPRAGEPVLFPGTDTVIGVIGLSCLGHPAKNCLFGWNSDTELTSGDTSFLSGITIPSLHVILKQNGGLLTPEALASIALSRHGLRKYVTTQEYHVVFNQADCLSKDQLEDIRAAAQKIRDNGAYCHIVSLKKRIFY